MLNPELAGGGSLDDGATTSTISATTSITPITPSRMYARLAPGCIGTVYHL